MINISVPETTYHRKVITPNISDTGSSEDVNNSKTEKISEDGPQLIYRKKTYFQELKVYNGVLPTKVSFWNLLLRPFIACITPVCLWAGLLYGVAITWLVLIATSVAQIFSAPRKPQLFPSL